MIHKKEDWAKHFPYDNIRPDQEQTINFVLDSFLNDNKKFVILEAATGIGKSAIAITVAKYLNESTNMQLSFEPGAYILTTQKILQQQYLKDFGEPNGSLLTIKSSSNYTCGFYRQQSCGASKRVLSILKGKVSGTPFAKHCRSNCKYTFDKNRFMQSPLSLTNYSYFLAETTYASKLKPRQLLIMDECHSTDDSLASFIEITFTENFAKTVLNINLPRNRDKQSIFNWVSKKYKTALKKQISSLESEIENFVEEHESEESSAVFKKFEALDKHVCKVNRFITKFGDGEKWILNTLEEFKGKNGKKLKFQFKPIDISDFSNEHLFKYGDKVLLMSATIVEPEIYMNVMGINKEDANYIKKDSPFSAESKPFYYLPVGKMSSKLIDDTLPKMCEAISEILKQHVDTKGIIHANNYKIANYIKNNIKDKRLLIQNDMNRDKILKYHMETSDPTILVSPSMTEGVDLKDNLSRFQIFCKVPFPYLGDEYVQKKMKMVDKWYEYCTARTIIQAAGRSIRNENDYATTYMLDECFSSFYMKNKNMFPKDFHDALKE